jgi:hypothetical protein
LREERYCSILHLAWAKKPKKREENEMIVLGSKVKDRITGFSGTVTGFVPIILARKKVTLG